MLKIILPLIIFCVACGKNIEQGEQVEEIRSPASTSIEAEVSLKAGVSSMGNIFSTKYDNKIDDFCLDIPETITDLSGAFDEGSELKFEINKAQSNGTDYVYCNYELTDKGYSIYDCFDYQDRSLGIRSFWFSYVDKAITLSFKNISTTNQRQAKSKIELKACGS